MSKERPYTEGGGEPISDRLHKAARALLDICDSHSGSASAQREREALRAALAEPEPGGEPVLWACWDEQHPLCVWDSKDKAHRDGHPDVSPLFATPPETVPKALADAMETTLQTIRDYTDHVYLTKGAHSARCAACHAAETLAAYRAATKGGRG